MPNLGYISLIGDNDVVFTALLGDQSPVPVYTPGWTITSRPRKVALTDWTGREPLRMTISFLVDTFAENDGVECEKQCRNLEKLAGIDNPVREPPHCKIDSGGAVPHDMHDAAQLEWVIEDLQWGDALRNRAGNRVRQAGTVTMLQFVDDKYLSRTKSPAKKNKDKKGKSKKRKRGRHVVQSGETLPSIAIKEYGKDKRWMWHRIATLNHLHGPRDIKQGQILTLPYPP